MPHLIFDEQAQRLARRGMRLNRDEAVRWCLQLYTELSSAGPVVGAVEPLLGVGELTGDPVV